MQEELQICIAGTTLCFAYTCAHIYSEMRASITDGNHTFMVSWSRVHVNANEVRGWA